MSIFSHQLKNVAALQDKATQIRYETAKMAHGVGDARKAHPGPSLSTTDIIVALYYKHMNIDISRPAWQDRDRFILSKGHGCLSLYAVLADLGYFPKERLSTVRRTESILQGHPDMRKTPGIDMTAGSLGNGLGAGVGMALGTRLEKSGARTYVLLGDGELDEGVVWEAAPCAYKYGLDNLTAIVDYNGFQSCGTTEEILPFHNTASRWESVGWITRQIDGHNMQHILDALVWADQKEGKPKVIIAETVKGKGISFMENDNSWHQRALTDEQMQLAKKELRG